MTKKEDDNPLEEIQKQLRDLLSNKNVQVAFAPFMQGMKNEAEGDKESPKDPSPEAPPPTRDEQLEGIQAFDRKPKEIRDYLDRFVIKQEQAKRVLSVAVCDHYNHVRRCLEDAKRAHSEYVKSNVLLLGPTGVGKTFLMRNVAKLIGVPFVKADATKFSETGYVGYDVDDLVRDLVKAAEGDVELAQYGIIYVDEIDKIASEASRSGRDVSGRGVQINLLKLMEETEVNLHSPQDMMGQMKAFMEMQKGGQPSKTSISTKNILFIVSGAFDQLAENVRKRLDLNRIGFGSAEEEASTQVPVSNFLSKVETRDFIDYGFEPEFVGRLPVRVACDELTKEDLSTRIETCKGKENHLTRWKQMMNLLEAHGALPYVVIDLSIVRGLAYYTGFVYEAFEASGEGRALAGGGRYDHLLKKLSGNVDLPACGFAIGDMTLSDCLAAKGLTPNYITAPDLYVIAGETQTNLGISMASRARKAGFSASYSLKAVGFGKQFKDAGKSGARYALILGEEEEQTEQVKIKDLRNSAEVTVAQSSMLAKLEELDSQGGIE